MIISEDEIRNKIEKVSNNIKELSIEYLFNGIPAIIDNKPTLLLNPIPKNDYMIILRDSIQYKFRSILFHRYIFKQVIDSFNKQLSKDYNHNKHHELFYSCTEQAMYVVDDIIFHLISLFDYLGNLVGFLFYGDNKRRIKWDGIVRCCKNPEWENNNTGSNKINRSNVSIIVQILERKILQKLREFRAELIHYRYYIPGGEMTISLTDLDSSRIHLETPKRLYKIIKGISKDIIDEKIHLDVSIEILLEKIADDVNDFTEKLRLDLRNMIRVIK